MARVTLKPARLRNLYNSSTVYSQAWVGNRRDYKYVKTMKRSHSALAARCHLAAFFSSTAPRFGGGSFTGESTAISCSETETVVDTGVIPVNRRSATSTVDQHIWYTHRVLKYWSIVLYLCRRYGLATKTAAHEWIFSPPRSCACHLGQRERGLGSAMNLTFRKSDVLLYG